jgi:hypothetical protein
MQPNLLNRRWDVFQLFAAVFLLAGGIMLGVEIYRLLTPLAIVHTESEFALEYAKKIRKETHTYPVARTLEGERFHADNAVGAAANALEGMNNRLNMTGPGLCFVCWLLCCLVSKATDILIVLQIVWPRRYDAETIKATS